MATSNELRVFISSTFRDLQEEREHLVKKIFPEIRALCRARGVTFTDIDLRWGLTEEEAVLGRVIRTCLEEVDLCRPYFIGVIGNRYGWAPEIHEIPMDHQLLAKYPWIEDVAMNGASVTELEFIHGVFDAPPVDGEYAFFYHRAGNIDEVDDPTRLASLIDRSRNSGKPFREFQSVDELGEQVRSDLIAMIDRYWPEHEAPTALELQRRAHAAFAASRIRAYIPNPLYLNTFTTWLAEGTTPLVIRGESGSGKSSLVAWLTDSFRKKNPTAVVIEHYVGAAQTSGSAVSVMRHVIDEICARFQIDEEIPAKEEELQRSFPNWLFRCEHLAKEAGVPVMMVVDAVNQLGESSRQVSWLPETIPRGITFVISTTPGETEDQLRKRPWEQLVVTPLTDERVRQSIVVRYLGEFHKGITPGQVRRVTADPKASSPLYLRVVAEEMRLHGEHETLDEKIGRYVDAADLEAVFDRVLERIEQDYGLEPVRDLLSVIWASRSGLQEIELLEITGLSRLELSHLLFAFDYHFVQRQGTLAFFHEYLRRAVEKRYLAEPPARRRRSLQIAAYFERADVTIRSTLELLHALESLGDRERLEHAAAELQRFAVLWPGAEKDEILRVWSGSDRASVVAAYRSSLEEWVRAETPEPRRHARTLRMIGALFQIIGAWTDVESVQRKRLALVRQTGDRSGETSALTDLSFVTWSLGRLEEAKSMAREAERVARELGDRKSIAVAVGGRGLVHWNQGESEEALACFAEQESIARAIGDRRSVASAVGNRDLVLHDLGEFAKALACYAEQESIDRAMGDRQGISRAMGNRGNVHTHRGEYEEALACYAEQESIARSDGDRRGICTVVGNRGLVHKDRGEYEEALRCYAEQESIARALGGRRSVGLAIGNRGDVYCEQAEYEEALACFHAAIAEHREIVFRNAVAAWLEGSARAMLALSERETDPPPYLARYAPEATGAGWKGPCRQQARLHAEESLAISREVHILDMLHSSQVLIARLDAADGRTDIAIERLRTMLAEAGDDGERANLHYWLWKLGVAEHATAAFTLYETLYAKIPKYEYRKRLEECKIVD